MAEVMFPEDILRVLREAGKPVVIRKLQNDGSWIDYMEVGEVQPVSFRRKLTIAGIIEIGEARAYFPSWLDLAYNDRVIQDAEFIVRETVKRQLIDGTLYTQVLLRQAHQTIQADFYGPNRIFFDDFESNRETWTVKSGSWDIQEGQYVGESAEVALSIAGEEWDNYVIEALITIESGDAGLACRFSSPDNIDQCYIVALRVSEGICALEALKGNEWTRLKTLEYNLAANEQYKLRVHCFRSYLMVFLNREYLFTLNDLVFKAGKIGCITLNGKAKFDNVTTWRI